VKASVYIAVSLDGFIARARRSPVVIGSGIPLFGPLTRDVPLLHVNSRVYATGLAQSEYQAVASGVHGA
jgi:hypothetical protein